MPGKQNDAPVYLDEHHQRISEFAAEYFDDDDERDEFVGTLMERRGYKQRTRVEWDPPDPPADDRGRGRGGATPPPGGQRRPAYFKR